MLIKSESFPTVMGIISMQVNIPPAAQEDEQTEKCKMLFERK